MLVGAPARGRFSRLTQLNRSETGKSIKISGAVRQMKVFPGSITTQIVLSGKLFKLRVLVAALPQLTMATPSAS